MKIILAYVPVIHRGYLELLERCADHEIWIFDRAFLTLAGLETQGIRKDLRALSATEASRLLSGLFPQRFIGVINKIEDLNVLLARGINFIMPDDEICRGLQVRFLPKERVEFERVFLRYDMMRTIESRAVVIDRQINVTEFDREVMMRASEEADKSSDWWRRVGAALVLENKVRLVTYNRHLPNEYAPYYQGDPRANFSRGVQVELSTVIHAEAGIIAEAARLGLSLSGAWLYVTTFPCPPCAKLTAFSGITKCFYLSGYSLLDGEEVLRERGIEIIQVVL